MPLPDNTSHRHCAYSRALYFIIRPPGCLPLASHGRQKAQECCYVNPAEVWSHSSAYFLWLLSFSPARLGIFRIPGCPYPALADLPPVLCYPLTAASESTIAETPPGLLSHQRKHKSSRGPPSLAHFLPLALSTALTRPAPFCPPCQISCSSLTHTPSWRAYGCCSSIFLKSCLLVNAMATCSLPLGQLINLRLSCLNIASISKHIMHWSLTWPALS